MIPERYMVQGERLDNRKIVKGSLVDRSRWFGCYEIIVYNSDVRGDCYFTYEVDPKTVESVAVKVICEGFDGDPYCPNCDKNLMGCMPVDFEDEVNYCPKCGQRLDWSVE